MSDVFVRDFCRSDLDDVLEVARLSFAAEFAVAGFDADRVKKLVGRVFGARGKILIGFLKLLGNEPFKFLVAEAASRVVGTTMVTKQGQVGYIANVMVHPNCRRRGIARTLMKAATAYIQSRKMKRAVLHVASSNEPARRLYTGLGFREFEKIEHFVGYLDALSQPVNVEGIQIRKLQKGDIDAVYELVRSSEDPQRLEVFPMSKSGLRTSFVSRATGIAKMSKIVALHDNRIVGYAHISWTTPNEAARITQVHVSPQIKMERLTDMLVHDGMDEIRKAGIKKIVGQASLKKPELIAAMNRMGFEKYLETEGMVLEFR